MNEKKILIVPASSEIAHEIVRSLKNVKGIKLYGANTIEAFSELDSSDIVTGIPHIDEVHFLESINNIIEKKGITHVFPAHDAAAFKLSKHQGDLKAKVVSSTFETNRLCRSKKRTYKALRRFVQTPELYTKQNVTKEMLPLFAKPDVGQGSVGTFKIESLDDLARVTESDLICEYLPGDEFTVDCISDSTGNLLSANARIRSMMRNGIAVETSLVKEHSKFIEIAQKINEKIAFRGAWFFQVKEDINGELCLLEVATRIAGSMVTSRFNGINYAELSLLISDDIAVKTIDNALDVTLYRNLSIQFKSNLTFDVIYSDFDDCLIFGEKVNTDLISVLYQALNDGKSIKLITRHEGNLEEKLKEMRLNCLFDEIIHITDRSPKSSFISESSAIFIDDSFQERKDVSEVCKIPCFSVDMIRGLLCLKN